VRQRTDTGRGRASCSARSRQARRGSDGLPTDSGLGPSSDGSIRMDSKIRVHVGRMACIALSIAGVVLFSAESWGIVAIARLMATGYAAVPEQVAQQRARGVLPRGSKDLQEASAGDALRPMEERFAGIRRNRSSSCPECGVIASLKPIEDLRDTNIEALDRNVDRGNRSAQSGHAIAFDAISTARYEITVRFRDGSTAVFNETAPFVWRLGSRVIVVAGLPTS